MVKLHNVGQWSDLVVVSYVASTYHIAWGLFQFQPVILERLHGTPGMSLETPEGLCLSSRTKLALK